MKNFKYEVMVVFGPTRQLRTALRVTETGGVSVKKECLDRIIPLGERHFRHAVTEFVGHYHRERNHQGQRNELIERVGPPLPFRGPDPSAAATRRLAQLLRADGVASARTGLVELGRWTGHEGPQQRERERTLCAGNPCCIQCSHRL